MNKLDLLKLKKIISEYDYLVNDEEYKSEIIGTEKSNFLKTISERAKELNLESIDSEPGPKEDVGKSKEKKISDDTLSKSAKSDIKSMFRNIAKITHPDVIGSDHMVDYYSSAKEAYDLNDFLQICLISTKLNLELVIDEDGIKLLFDLIELKRSEISSIEKSWLWTWLSAETDEEKMIVVDSYCKLNFKEPETPVKNNNLNMTTDQIIQEIYSINPYEKKYRNKTVFKPEYPELYGEVTYQSTEAIVNQFKEHFNSNTVFYDMGSGLGKMVAHIGLKYSAKKSCGVELSRERMAAANEIKDKYCGENVIFIEDDFFKVDISDATVLYVDNTAMKPALTIKLFNMLPEGCLFICRRNCTQLNLTEIKHESLKTTYGKNNIFYAIK